MVDSSGDGSNGRGLDRRDSRRSFLKLGSIATLGAVLGGGYLYGWPSLGLAKTRSAGSATGTVFTIVIATYAGGTLLDFAGPSEIFHRLPNTEVRIASLNGGAVNLEFGIQIGSTERLSDIATADLLLIPGGPDLTEPTKPEYLAEVRRLAAGAKHITSVCTGSLVLAAAGLLKGKRSACHWAAINRLSHYGAIPVSERFVEDDNGRFMSGGGITSGIDFALRVAAKLHGRVAAELAQMVVEYDPDPPYHSGHPRLASPEVLEMVKEMMPGALEGLAPIPGVL